jgi:hypothetical protein
MKVIDKVIIPMLTVHNDELYLYGRTEWLIPERKFHDNSLKNLDNNFNHKKLSSSAKKKAKKAIKYMLYNANDKKVYNETTNSHFTYKVGFITLTLPSAQIHSDQEIKAKCLNHFLIEAKNKWNATNYVWKAERQVNGNLHFHILFDVWIPYRELRQVWNRIINKLGYVDRFEAKHKKKNPNSTDVHSLYKIKDVTKYIIKYMTKADKKNIDRVSMDNTLIENYQHITQSAVSKGAKKFLDSLASVGRIWACSTSLSNITGGQDIAEDVYMQEVDKIKKSKGTKVYNSEYVTCLYFDTNCLNAFDTPNLYGLFDSYVKSKFRTTTQLVDIGFSPPINN